MFRLISIGIVTTIFSSRKLICFHVLGILFPDMNVCFSLSHCTHPFCSWNHPHCTEINPFALIKYVFDTVGKAPSGFDLLFNQTN